MKKHFALPILLILFSCSSVNNQLPMETQEELSQSALIILGNPPGTYPVTVSDIPRLLEYTRNENPAIRHMAIYQLGQLNTTSFYDDILPLIIDDDKSVARNTEDLLLRNERAALTSYRKVLNDTNREIQLKALDILVLLNDRESLTQVIELFLHEDEIIVEKAISTAAKLGDVNDKIFFESLLRPETAIRVGIVKTLSLMGDPSILGTLLPYFYDPEIEVQNAVKFAFIDFGQESIPYLLNVLNNPAPQTQLAVLGLLEALKDPESIASIIQLFSNENQRVRERAIYTVSTFGELATEPLGLSLENDNPLILLASTELLGQIKTREALLSLISLLDHDDLEIRENAYNKVLLYGAEAGDQFLRILDRRDENLYSPAVKGLMRLQDNRLLIDNLTSLFNLRNRNKALINFSTQKELDRYLLELSISGLLERDFTHIKRIYDLTRELIIAEKEIEDSGSKYTTFYISRNDFIKKSEDAQKLSFTYMRNYMDSRDPEDLEVAKKQQEFSEMFKIAADDLTSQLETYIGSTEREKELIDTFENSRSEILSFYDSVSINRKNLTDEILSDYGLTYEAIVSGNF